MTEALKKKPIKQDDGWEKIESAGTTVYFLHTTYFDVCVWKGQFYEPIEDGTKVCSDCWGMSCHKHLGFSVALPDARDQRTAKLMALEQIMGRMRRASHHAAQMFKQTVDTWAAREEGKKPLREIPLGKPANVPCVQCGAVPTLPLTKLCGPCTFGDPATAGGNW